MIKTTQIPEIGAEMLLNCLYPELREKWTAHHDGTFYRNYNRDVMEIDPETMTVWLSRDGFLELLPQGLLSKEDEFKSGDVQEKHRELDMQRRILSEAFLPFDSINFRSRLRLEGEISGMLSGKLEYILKTYFDYDLAAEKNPYVREFAVLLPYIRHWRGDTYLIKNLLSAIFHCEVTFTLRRYSESDSSRAWLPCIRYDLLMPNLTGEEYRALYSDLQPLAEFLSEWFLPAETRLELRIKHHSANPLLNTDMILDYNTEL